MTDLTAPQFIKSRYRLLDKLGEGGMGTVYRAADRLTGQIIALKRVTAAGDQLQFASQSTDQDFRLSLAQEFRTLAGLRHPHIVSVLDYGFDEQRQPFFTMQLVEGAQELTAYAAAQPTSGKVRVLVETLQALAYLHRRGIIHRDLKPGNVLVTAEGSVRVMDFGLALTQVERTSDDAFSAVGTLTYMAPELFRDERATTQSDLYAVGVMAYEIFLGHYPFTSQNVIQMVNAILNSTPDTTRLDFELADVIDKLLAKAPWDRYQTADALIEALVVATDQGMPEENAALRDSYLQAAKFVGRDAETEQLLAALDQTIKKQGSTWLIGGESGVGKSRLVDELRTHALVAGALVLRGQGVEGGGLPYQLWREPLRHLVLSTPLSDLEAGILKPLVPDISTLLERPVPDAPEIPGQAGRQRLVLTIAAIFKRQSTSIVLLLEDLQWANENLFPLRHLNELVSTLPLLIIGTYRDDETAALPTELPAMRLLKLNRLNEEAIAKLSESMLGEAGTQPELLNLLTRETEGNTFFMVEVVRALAEEAGRLEHVGAMPLPKSILTGGVDRIVRRRLSRVPEKLHPWLTLAAIAGRQLDLKVLAYVVAPGNLDDFLTTCAAAAVLEVADATWRFAHDKLRESLLKAIPADQRPALHRQIAEALEAVYPDVEAYAEVLMEHWYNAGDLEKTLHYTSPTCEHLILTLANYATARILVTRGLSLIDRLPAERQDQYRASLLRWLAVIDQRQGDYPQAIANYEASLQHIGTDLQMRVRVLSGLSTVTEYQGDNRASSAYAKQALELAEQIGDRQGIGESLNNLGIVALNLADYDTARTYYERSLAIKQNLGNQRGISAALNNLAVLVYQLGDYAKSIEYQEQSLAIDRAMGDRLGIADGLSNLGAVQSKLGHHAAARAYYEESLVIDYEIGDRRGIAGTMMNIGNVVFDLKDYASARSYYEASLELSRAIGDQRGTSLGLIRLGLVTLELNEIPAARTLLREGLQSALEHELTQFMAEAVLHFAYLHFLTHDPATSALRLGVVAAQLIDGDTPVELIQALQAKLATAMGTEALSAALERGKTLDLGVVARQILAEIGATSP